MSINMRRTLSIILLMAICLPLAAQKEHRDSVLTQARYMKSIYRTDEAIEALSALVQPGAIDEGVFAELADCYFQSGAYDDAVGGYFMLSSLKPDNLLYKIRLMQCYYRLRAYPESVQAGKSVLQAATIPAVVNIVGDGYWQMEQADSALCYYRKYLEMKPTNEKVVSKAMGILVGKKQYDEAIAISKPLLDEDPENASYLIHYYLGQCYWHTDVLYRAEKELLAAWQIDSSDVNLAYTIAAVKSDCHYSFKKDIQPWLDKAWQMLQPDPSIASRIQQQYGLGYYRMQNSWDKAIAHYKEAYRYNPNFISALSTIAYCYQMKKDYKQAVEWYEKYLKVVKPGSRGYEFAKTNLDYLKTELFMEEQ